MVDIYEKAGKVAAATTDIAVKGTGVGVGAVLGSALGGVAERGIIGNVTKASSSMTKFLGWGINNGFKGVLAYAAHEMNPEKALAEKGVTGDFVDGASYGFAGSIILDTIARGLSGWVPPTVTSASPIMEKLGLEQHPDYNAISERIHSLLMENSSLKQQIGANAAQNAGGYGLETPPTGIRERRYEFTPGDGYPGSGGREREYEFTEPGVPGVVKEKRGTEKQFQFTAGGKVITGSVTDANVLQKGFGFIV